MKRRESFKTIVGGLMGAFATISAVKASNTNSVRTFDFKNREELFEHAKRRRLPHLAVCNVHQDDEQSFTFIHVDEKRFILTSSNVTYRLKYKQ